MIYIAEAGHPRYGQAGNLEFHDRRGRGVLGVRFSDGILEELPDHLSEAYGEKGIDLHWWLK